MSSEVFFSSQDSVFENTATRDNPKLVSPFGPEIYFSRIDPILLKELQNKISTHRFTRYNNENLAGIIEKEFILDLDHSIINKLNNELLYHVNKMFKEYVNFNFEKSHREIKSFRSSDPWINFQKKNEFNPPHRHSGILSYVIYVNIPDNVRNNHKQNEQDFQFNCRGLFEFRHNDMPMNISPKTGDIFLFPASLDHAVYPFDCDDIRISISGNIFDYNIG